MDSTSNNDVGDVHNTRGGATAKRNASLAARRKEIEEKT